MSDRLREGLDSAREDVTRRYRRVEGTMARNPGPSVLLGFGLGVGLGLVIATLLGEREETWSEWAEHRARKPLRHAREAAEHMQDSAKHLPEAFHHLADTIARHLPSALTHR